MVINSKCLFFDLQKYTFFFKWQFFLYQKTFFWKKCVFLQIELILI